MTTMKAYSDCFQFDTSSHYSLRKPMLFQLNTASRLKGQRELLLTDFNESTGVLVLKNKSHIRRMSVVGTETVQ